jgi:hypothetical protein
MLPTAMTNHPTLRTLGLVALAAALAGSSIAGCAATSGSTFEDDDAGSASGNGGASTTSGSGQGGSVVSVGNGGSTSSGGEVTELTCAESQQEILVLDFRSGWWTGGGGGDFADVALAAMVEPCSNIHVEYHHFEVDFRIKCTAISGSVPSCQQVTGAISQASAQEILSWFEQSTWDDYTQVWILSGSELDAADVALTGSLFNHFLGETNGSCIPALIGAGDGFIDHGNAVAAELGLGQVFSTELAQPGFFSVAFTTLPNYVNVDSYMQSGTELESHLLFTEVGSLVDTVSSDFQTAHGDSVNESDSHYDVIAHDTAGRPSIAVGEIVLAGGDDRPFIIDAGFQRYYAGGYDADTRKFLQNMVLYLGLVGCKADIPE